jgi:hypothetical protein
MSTETTTKDAPHKDAPKDPKDAAKEAKELYQANLESFLDKFKSITPEQQIALNNLRTSIEAVVNAPAPK